MLEFFVVRSNCLSISFLFAHLCSLLEAIGRQHLEVGFFVGRNFPLRFALCSFFPLVLRSVGFAQMLVMSGEGKVRCSELETNLSSSGDCRALEVTSPSTPYKAWDICCALKGKDGGELGTGSNFFHRSRLESPMTMIELAILTLTKCVSTRLTLLVVFAFPSHPFLGSFSVICSLLLPN